MKINALSKRRWDDEINGGDDTLMLNFNVGVERLEAEFFLAACDRVKEINSNPASRPNRHHKALDLA